MLRILWAFFNPVFLLSIFLISSCGGGGGGGGGNNENVSSITISKCNVTPSIISKSNPQSIQFNWEVKKEDTSSLYYIDIYLSQDDVLDDSDILLVSINTKNNIGNFTLNTYTPTYERISNLYCGQYYIIFIAHNNSNKYSIDYFSNFILKAKWSVIIYMDGDNSLVSELDDDLNKIMSVGSTKDINIIVEADTNSDSTKRYFIRPNELVLLDNLGELNMADPNTLTDFLNWSTDKYLADHYFLILWDHGKGFKRKFLYTRNIFWDTTSNNTSMSISDMATSLELFKNKIKKKIDIVGFDACLMNMLEVVYEIKDSAAFIIGSENTEPSNGWPYNSILEYLATNADTINSQDLSKKIVEQYIDYYYNTSYEATLSAIDTSQIDILKDKLNKLAVNLIEGLKNDTNGTLRNSIKTTVFNNVQRFDDGNLDGIDRYDDSYVDLFHLCYLIKKYLPAAYKNYAQNVIDALTNVIILSQNSGGSVANAYGLSIWLPDPSIYSFSDWSSYQQQYSELRFYFDTKWDDFIIALWEY